ncbi:hypothetical protein D1872_224000 [compost metagenome]
MAQNIKLEQIGIEGMIIKVSRHPFRVCIISRILDWRNIFNLNVIRNYDYTARMLPRTALHSGTAGCKTIQLSSAPMLLMFFFIFLRKAECRLLGDSTYCTRTEHIFLAKHNLGEIVGLRLIFTGKVKIDIGHLIPLKTKKGFKRNILSFSFKLMATIWTILIRQVKSARNAAVLEPFTMFAFRVQTNVMSRQRVNLGYAEEGCHYRGTYRTPGADQISVLIGLFH